MCDHIDYFFTSVSPFTWLGHQALLDIAGRHGKRVAYRPFNMMEVWEVSGAVPPARRSPTRQRYRLVELQRTARMRGLKLKPIPKTFPTDPAQADHCIVAITENGGDPGDFLFCVGEALWRDERQVADKEVLGELLRHCGHDPDRILALAAQDRIAEIRADNTRAAIAADVIGAPAYVYSGEVFWGQDRLDDLDEMIGSGRGAFSPQV
jgi:2-hydroxychromene-2-carboxylate isomerase